MRPMSAREEQAREAADLSDLDGERSSRVRGDEDADKKKKRKKKHKK
jgi:hypothetical protein